MGFNLTYFGKGISSIRSSNRENEVLKDFLRWIINNISLYSQSAYRFNPRKEQFLYADSDLVILRKILYADWGAFHFALYMKRTVRKALDAAYLYKPRFRTRKSLGRLRLKLKCFRQRTILGIATMLKRFVNWVGLWLASVMKRFGVCVGNSSQSSV